MKKIFYTILAVLTLSVAAVAILYFLQPALAKNGFNRGQIRSLSPLKVLGLKYNSYYIQGLNAEDILLGNYTSPRVFSCGYNLRSLHVLPTPFDKDAKTYTLPAGFFKDRKDNFSVDGFACYNKAAGKVIYTFYYRNKFLCLDTGMNLLYTASLIDTNSVAKIELGEYKADGKRIRTLAKPALTVNKRAYSNGNFVFIESALAADNEDQAVFDKHVVLDVYLLNNGSYSYSLYLPKYNGEKLLDFAVQGDLLIALYEKHLVSYSINGKEVF